MAINYTGCVAINQPSAQHSGDEVARQRAAYAHSIASLERHAAKLSVSPQVAEEQSKWRGLSRMLGASYWDSVMVCAHSSGVLLSDDSHLRQMAQAAFGAAGVCTAHLLLHLARTGLIPDAVVSRAYVKLAVWGYRRVPTNALTLEAAAELTGWRPEGAFLRVLETIRAADVDTASAVTVVVKFFRIAWFHVLLAPQRDALMMAAISALAAGRPTGGVLGQLRTAIRQHFALLPDAERELLALVAAWEHLHLHIPGK